MSYWITGRGENERRALMPYLQERQVKEAGDATYHAAPDGLDIARGFAALLS